MHSPFPVFDENLCSATMTGVPNWLPIDGFGDCVESRGIDAMGNITKSRSDAAGRALEIEDAEGRISTAKYHSRNTMRQRIN